MKFLVVNTSKEQKPTVGTNKMECDRVNRACFTLSDSFR